MFLNSACTAEAVVLSLPAALPIFAAGARRPVVEAEAAEAADLDAVAREQRLGHRIEDHLHRVLGGFGDRKSTRLNSCHLVISYGVFCLNNRKELKNHTDDRFEYVL